MCQEGHANHSFTQKEIHMVFENLTSQKVRSDPYGDPVEVWVGGFITLSGSKILFSLCNTMK